MLDLGALESPVVQAGMGAVARHELAAAVSEAGGLGTIARARALIATESRGGAAADRAADRRQPAAPVRDARRRRDRSEGSLAESDTRRRASRSWRPSHRPTTARATSSTRGRCTPVPACGTCRRI
jgi:hypothetical protein